MTTYTVTLFGINARTGRPVVTGNIVRGPFTSYDAAETYARGCFDEDDPGGYQIACDGPEPLVLRVTVDGLPLSPMTITADIGLAKLTLERMVLEAQAPAEGSLTRESGETWHVSNAAAAEALAI